MVVGSEHWVADFYLALLCYKDIACAHWTVSELLVFQVLQTQHNTAQNTPNLMLLKMIFFSNPQVQLLV
jgi:hypothetical protein